MQPYDRTFYEINSDTSYQSATKVVPLVLELINCNSVIDIGCGTGTWLRAFQEHGVADLLGIDGDYVDKGMLQIPEQNFISYNLKDPYRSERRFDLVVSLEVGEHLPDERSDAFVETLTRLGPVVLFSAAVPHQTGTFHINEQWPDYWAEKFRKQNFTAVDCLRHKIWNDPQVEWWYAQNIFIYAQQEYFEANESLREAARGGFNRLSVVHPGLHLHTHDLTTPEYVSVKYLFRTLPLALINACKRRMLR